MATLHKEYSGVNGFNENIRLTDARKDSLLASRKSLRKKIKDWFLENKPNELQPKFHGQGSKEMNTICNPIPEKDKDGANILKFDLDDGVYFIEKDEEDNRRSIDTWHDWIYEAVKDHTDILPQKKNTCIRVLFADGHHIDLPIYYKNDDVIELAHKGKGWIESDPKEFYEWFNKQCNSTQQLRRIVRFLKAWKNNRELKNTNLKLASGFALSILAVNNYIADDNDDRAFRETVRCIKNTLDYKFECIRPTTPEGEDVFKDFSDTRKTNILNSLDSLIKDCDKARDEDNFKTASEYLRNNQFGARFPLGKDESEKEKSNRLKEASEKTSIVHRPYHE